ncbi:MAG: multicopper oxidase family protein [Pseudomonadota bacterium]
MNRRQLLKLGGVSAMSSLLPTNFTHAKSATAFALSPQPGTTNIVGPDFPNTAIWGYNGQVPGQALRLTRGDQLNVVVTNQLKEATAVHWHGIRLPNAMDGVAGLTQQPIAPGESFTYEFTPPDAGTYWYHSHLNAHEQIGRGLYGPLIIEEPNPPVVDRDLVWMIDDWRLKDDASISNDFDNGHDKSHAGRIGNVPTVNGRFRDVVKVRTGERLRLRLINASNARNFALSFPDHQPTIIAIDGQPVTPYQPQQEIIIGAAGRVDLMIDMSAAPGTISPVTDRFYRQSFDLVKFVYEDKPLRESAIDADITLDAADLPEPDMNNAITQQVTIAGGAMGGLQRAMFEGEWMDLRSIARQGYVWAINDIVGHKMHMPPLIDVKRGQSVVVNITNETAFPHPMHLHGHHMKLLEIDGEPLASPHWVDNPLVLPGQNFKLAFVADNPGDWLFHCHALEHHAAGLGTLVRVT